jgi:uncharacterized membrane protein
MRIAERVDVAAPAEAIWEEVDTPARYLLFMSGITRWEVVSGPGSGLGTRMRILLRVGAAEVGSLVEVVEHDPPRDLAWTSVTGIDQRGRWRLRPSGDGRTRVELRLAYGVAGGGLSGLLAERLAAPQVRRHVRRSLRGLKRRVEHEQARRAAALRRAAHAG